jgi:ribosome-associated translation inhibitor RaiA
MHFHLLSFEGPDDYARAGGIATRITGLARALAEAGYDTHLWFIGDPDRPGHEHHDQLWLHRWCQWISRYHPAGVYDGEEGKRLDYAASLPPFLLRDVLLPTLRQGERAVILAEEWHTVDAVLHLDWLLRQAGVHHQVTIFWNANNTYSFERIDWGRLAQAAIITTVSRYMKHLLWGWGVDPLVLPNGLAADALVPPARDAVAAFRQRVRGRTVVSKVARWHPDKRWLLAVDTVGAMKRLGWRPLLVARGGVEAHGAEVLATAASAGLQVVERPLSHWGVRGLLQALEGLEMIDIVSLTSPLEAASTRLLFHSSDAVLANSGHEPFGLVGLETMAVGGVACTGASGEDYAIPGHNALVLETLEPREFIGLFGDLRGNPPRERALRQSGRLTAKQYMWSQIVPRVLLPRLRLLLSPEPRPTARLHSTEPARLRVHIDSQQTHISPYLLGWIAERLEDLNTLRAGIASARVTLVKHQHRRRHREEARVEVMLAGQTLQATQIARTPYDAVYAALKSVERQLHDVGVLEGVSHRSSLIPDDSALPASRANHQDERPGAFGPEKAIP